MAVKMWFCDGEMANTRGQVIRVHPTENGFEVTYTESEDSDETTEIVFKNNTLMVRKVNNGTNG